MKYIITESQKERIQILRRLDVDWKWITEIVDEGLDYYEPCDFKTKEIYLERLAADSAQTYLLSYLDDWTSETFKVLKDHITFLIKKRMKDDIDEYYEDIKPDCEEY
jgi:hypothetical protein